MDLRMNLVPAPAVLLLLNVGATFDVPFGHWIPGRYGENILNGGIGYINGFVAGANMGKSMLAEYTYFTAASRVAESTGSIHDTENNKHEERLRECLNYLGYFGDEDVFDSGRMILTNANVYSGDQWFDEIREYCDRKVENRKSILSKTPFMDRDRKNNLMVITPTFGILDSLSAFKTKDVMKMQDTTSLGDSEANMLYMRQGAQKKRMLSEFQNLSGAAMHFLFIVAQVGEKVNMDPYAPQTKQLSQLKGNQKIKGVSEEFLYNTANCFQCISYVPEINSGTKGSEYPKHADEEVTGAPDLMRITVKQLRSKAGSTGSVLEIMVSQKEGVLPSLTEFVNIKTNGRFGLEGNDRNYALSLLPEVSLSRTTVRSKLDENPKLRRAMNITSELCQCIQFQKFDQTLNCTPKELYDDLKAMGYDWDILLNTRGYYVVGDDSNELPFLSTKDLCMMRVGKYHPYWLAEDKKTIIQPDPNFLDPTLKTRSQFIEEQKRKMDEQSMDNEKPKKGKK